VKVGSIRMMARRERSEQGQQAGGTSAAPMAPICEAEAKRSAPSMCLPEQFCILGRYTD